MSFTTPPPHIKISIKYFNFIKRYLYSHISFICFLALTFVLVGCKTLKNGSEGQENTTLKAVSDSQYILRLAPYASESDSSAFVFEVCPISSPNDACTIAFLSSIGHPVLFTASEINQHSESAAKAMTKFVKSNPELDGVVGAAAGGLVTYQVGAPKEEKSISARRRALSEKLGLEVDRFDRRVDRFGTPEVTAAKPAKLEAHLKAHGHVFKQDFVDFIKVEYASELAANNKTAEQILEWAEIHELNNEWGNRPQMDFGMLVRKYRQQLHGGIVSDVGDDVDYQKAIKDIVHPSMAEELKKYNKLLELTETMTADSMIIGRDSLQEFFDGSFVPQLEFHRIPHYQYQHQTKSIGTSAVSHLSDFTRHEFRGDEILRHPLLIDTVDGKPKHLSSVATTKAATKPVAQADLEEAVRSARRKAEIAAESVEEVRMAMAAGGNVKEVTVNTVAEIAADRFNDLRTAEIAAGKTPTPLTTLIARKVDPESVLRSARRKAEIAAERVEELRKAIAAGENVREVTVKTVAEIAADTANDLRTAQIMAGENVSVTVRTVAEIEAEIKGIKIANIKAVKKPVSGNRLTKRLGVVFLVIAGIIGGVAGSQKIFGVGSSVEKEEGIARIHPSLFEASAKTSPVDTVQGIVLQLGEYLNKSGVDIDYYCMPSGCQLLH